MRYDSHSDLSSGANTDLLGRRWFLVGGNVFCFIGHLVVATAKGNRAVIVGMGLSLCPGPPRRRR